MVVARLVLILLAGCNCKGRPASTNDISHYLDLVDSSRYDAFGRTVRLAVNHGVQKTDLWKVWAKAWAASETCKKRQLAESVRVKAVCHGIPGKVSSHSSVKNVTCNTGANNIYHQILLIIPVLTLLLGR